MSLMKEPLGDGNVRVTQFEDYKKYKFDNPDKVWMEFEPIRIFPDIWGPLNTKDDE
jgi:hypothetical protein